jgi:hypothetical protein
VNILKRIQANEANSYTRYPKNTKQAKIKRRDTDSFISLRSYKYISEKSANIGRRISNEFATEGTLVKEGILSGAC